MDVDNILIKKYQDDQEMLEVKIWLISELKKKEIKI